MRIAGLLPAAFLLAPSTLALPWTPNDTCPDSIVTYVHEDPCSYGRNDQACLNARKFSNMASIHYALKTCPNITAIDLSLDTGGCTGSGRDSSNFPFNLSGGDVYPSLKSLKLNGYQFEASKWLVRYRSAPRWKSGFQQWVGDVWTWVTEDYWENGDAIYRPMEGEAKRSNLAMWLDAMDWSSIEELKIDIGSVTKEMVTKLPRELKALKKLDLPSLPFVQALQKNSLTHLTWIGKSQSSDLEKILKRQGETLQSIEFRCDEMHCPEFTPDFDVSVLPTMTRNLRHLAVNVPRNGTWPLETLEIIALLPHLESIAIYTNLQSTCAQQRPDKMTLTSADWRERYGNFCTGRDQYMQPWINKTTAEDVFTFMRERNGELGLMTNATLYVGDWSQSFGGPLYFPPWLESKMGRVICSSVGKSEAEVEKNGWCVEGRERFWTENHFLDEEDEDGTSSYGHQGGFWD